MRLHRLSCVVIGGGLILGAAALGHGAPQSAAAIEATPGDETRQVVTVQLPAGAIEKTTTTFLNNSSGFGGSNVCHVFRKFAD